MTKRRGDCALRGEEKQSTAAWHGQRHGGGCLQVAVVPRETDVQSEKSQVLGVPGAVLYPPSVKPR